MAGNNIVSFVYLLVSAFVLTLILILLIPFLSQFSEIFRQQQCQPYIQTISQKDVEISNLKDQLDQTNKALSDLSQKYERLIKENITKKDIEEIKLLFNNTQSQINLLNQKYDIVNNNFISVYNQLFLFFSLSIVLNIFLIFFIIGDLISVTVFKVDLKKKFIDWLISKIRRKNKEEVSCEVKL